MRYLSSLLFASLLTFAFCGCQSSMRTVIGPHDFFYHAEVPFTGNKNVTFKKLETSLIAIYPDWHVMQHNNAKTGVVVLRPFVIYQVGGPSGASHQSHYTLDIKVAEKTAVLAFLLEPDFRGDWPPKNQIPLIKQQFRTIALKVAADMGGTLANERDWPKKDE